MYYYTILGMLDITFSTRVVLTKAAGGARGREGRASVKEKSKEVEISPSTRRRLW